MLHDLFMNTLLLISFTFVGGHLIRELSDKLVKRLYGKIIIGLGGGLLGVLMMVYTIEFVGSNTLLDLRALAMMIISSVGGFTATVISGTIILFYRIGTYGITQSSIFAVIHIILYITIFHMINRRINTGWKNWFLKLGVSLVILDSTFFYLLRHEENFLSIISFFTLVNLSAGALEYYLLSYAKYSNDLYRMYKKDSTRDFLTGLNNTRNFDKLLNSTLEAVQEKSERLSCLMVDIDHFKKVNDTYGHAVGDIVLKDLACILKANCRAFDIIGRVGGEEFCVLLLDCPSDRSVEIGNRIRNAVKGHSFEIGDDRFIKITVSVGSATYPENVSSLEEIKKVADDGLYMAKRSGRDRVCVGSSQ